MLDTGDGIGRTTTRSAWLSTTPRAISMSRTQAAGGGVSVVSLSTHTLTTPSRPGRRHRHRRDRSCGRSGSRPAGTEILAVLDGLTLPRRRPGDDQPDHADDHLHRQSRDWRRHHGRAGQRQHARLRVGHRPDRQRRRRPEPQPRRLRPGEPALRHGRRRHVGASPRAGADGDHLERPAALRRGCRRGWHLEDLRHACASNSRWAR